MTRSPGSAVLTVTGLKQRESGSGTTTFTFTVTRSGETTTAVNVDYVTSDGTASASSDYAAASGNLAFASNQTIATVDVNVNGDRLLEHNETFFLGLLNPSVGAAISTGQATGTIVNDDTKTTAIVKRPRGEGTRRRTWARVAGSRAQARDRPIVPQAQRRLGPHPDEAFAPRWVNGCQRGRLHRQPLRDEGSGARRPVAARSCAAYPGDAKFAPSRAIRLFRC